ncbi:hypothetical protein E4U56_000057 [Claviceps arundinis]|uniref:C3H1-type domain-containing protein n=1 Tax=Claviceps arundinis TaxID=1623583 RepID=A0A9P7N0B1_9HYPO|nr:hypothetical protein E4U56_000057 [Claviceps arundinis]
MNKPGPVFVPHDGYNPHQDFVNDAQAPRNSAVYQSNGTSGPSFSDQQNVAFSYSHSVIPGLGLGGPNSLAQPWAGSNEYATSWQAQSQKSPLLTSTPPVVQTCHASVNIPGLKGRRDDVSEDGEVGEDGEVEEDYEPADVHQRPTTVGQMQKHSSTAASLVPDKAYQQLANERDGSYSPHLSPQELSKYTLPGSQNRSHTSTITTGNQRSPNQLRKNDLCGLPNPKPARKLLKQDQLGHSRLEDARKQAKDAILYLWPLDVRFHHLLAEGIDKALLKSLYQDLGLSADEPSQTQKAINDTSCVVEAKYSEPTSNKKPEIEQSEEFISAAKDKSEERKDRIARLLAARGSKQSVSTAAVLQSQSPMSFATDHTKKQMQAQKPAPAEAEVGMHTQTQTKTQTHTQAETQTQNKADKGAKSSMSHLEKSKLIQQKLAALKRAREIPQSPNATLNESGNSGHNEPSLEASKAMNTSGLPESIPGLSLSPTKTRSESSEATGEPRPAHNVAVSQRANHPTAFDQNLKSRPFLIDISDEEEDEGEEMEIDSPVHPQSTQSILATTIRHDASLSDPLPVSESAMNRGAQSPTSVPMLSRSASGNNGGDLESMNKMIEEMKRKIAEAEARKKAKNSRQGSPALSQRHDSFLEDNWDTTPRQRSGEPRHGDLSAGSTPSPTQSGRSRSRVASERLPLLEARRRRRLEKLRDLQAQVARIELELENDKLEQEQLVEDMMDSDSEKDDALQPAMEEALTAKAVQTPQISEEMDVTEDSLPESTNVQHKKQHAALIGLEQNAELPGQLSASCVPVFNDTATVENSKINSDVAEANLGEMAATSPSENAMTASHGSTSSKMDISQIDDTPSVAQVDDEDVVMEDIAHSADEDAENDTRDACEPLDVTQPPLAAGNEPALLARPSSPAKDNKGPPAFEQAIPATSSPPAASVPNTLVHSVDDEAPSSSSRRTSFLPYETPLQYFHAYRFHPSFTQSVAGGLRSLTYSNKIDVKKELCPDELASQSCPRGSDCDYQHFENIRAPDDQILLQLGAAEPYEGQQRENYISGLKQLLTDYRNQNIRDFQIISQGVLDYRARFLGDKTKILPLGHITL